MYVFSCCARSKRYYCYCASGYRSAIAVSCVSGTDLDVVDLLGGFANLSVRYTSHTKTGKVKTNAHWSCRPCLHSCGIKRRCLLQRLLVWPVLIQLVV